MKIYEANAEYGDDPAPDKTLVEHTDPPEPEGGVLQVHDEDGAYKRSKQIETLDEQIDQRQTKLADLRREYGQVLSDMEQSRAQMTEEERQHTEKLQAAAAVHLEREAQLDNRQSTLDDREQVLKATADKISEQKKDMARAASEAAQQVVAAEKRLEVLTGQITSEEAAITELTAKRKKLDADYMATNRSYQDAIGHRVSRLNKLNREVEAAATTLAETRAANKLERATLEQERTIIAKREANLDEREKAAHNKEKAIRDRQKSLQAAVDEWKRRGVKVP